ncbi:ABC-2 type transporter-domain-containing protein [Hypoxylon trugodes]|uniref:ABC-2 type transporter-domain-containing protein n=1 Tax=Hypoxylon trugodes TaxID=326681 RepID=UPI0021925047|nr:ABC-2 type transporter-domain-containing protein [Hypoxylon trugodes]KAI1385114.1 ABC-2 type transporter-domain-containing protein [Hypoxylon trugodes]
MDQLYLPMATAEDCSGQSPPYPTNEIVEKPENLEKLQVGVTFVRLGVQGLATANQHAYNFLDYILAIPIFLISLLRPYATHKTRILHDLEGIIPPGEMLLVLGRPGSGCTTFLKVLAGNIDGLEVNERSHINYQGISYSKFHKLFQGERAYIAELDVHFPELTLGQTLNFAASTRSRKPKVEAGRDIALKFGLGAAFDTPIGNTAIRGLSGGEKRRASIAEACLGGARLQCWDNSTRGLDSSTARRFIKYLRQLTDTEKSTAAMSLYQPSEDIYQEFDKVTVLYEGRQIYYGPTGEAVDYFKEIGFVKPDRVTTADFLTSLTNPAERDIYGSSERTIPRLPDEFANIWRRGERAQRVRDEIASFGAAFSTTGHGNATTEQLGLRASTYPLSAPRQVLVCLNRAILRMRQNLSTDLTTVIANTILGLIIGSVYYGLDETTDSLQSRSLLLFFALILNAFSPAFEVVVVWAQRPIVEKHRRYAFYQPFTERAAAFICDIPIKATTCFGIHIPIYFLGNLRRSASAFFLYWLFMLVNIFAMSMLFRIIGSVSRSRDNTQIPVSFAILFCIIYTGFVVPPDYMVPWFGWFWRINPLAYTYENLMVNEMGNRLFLCSNMIPIGPSYEAIDISQRICATIGSQAGQSFVQGTAYLSSKYGYVSNHIWRNFGILLGMMVAFCGIHLFATQYISSQRSRGEVLVFKRTLFSNNEVADDEESAVSNDSFRQKDQAVVTTNTDHRSTHVTTTKAPASQQSALLYWSDLKYDIKGRTILQNVDGWLQAGTLTVLMGITGAGKTSLLNVLADRVTTGKVTGSISVGGYSRSTGYQRKLGYVQQDDVHMATATVREALEFSCLLRQPESKSKEEKLQYVNEVLELMDMQSYADALVGIPGEGLNLEQRKRLTIAVEMVAQPELLLFVDEPTSGLDSQTAWSICTLLRKLSDNGQTILCTIHQPSFQLFTMFDRLLLLGTNGKTLYFGDIGQDASTLVYYFESNGAPRCQTGENPAEWMLNITSTNIQSEVQHNPSHIDWTQIWNASKQRQDVVKHLNTLKGAHSTTPQLVVAPENAYATPFLRQMFIVTKRTFIDQWRNPVYLSTKIVVSVGTALLNGFSFFNTFPNVQGITSLLFSIFFATYLFSYIDQMVIPYFHRGIELFEVRERHSRTYSWSILLIANILVEVFWQTLISILTFASWYYPTGLSRNGEPIYGTADRGALTFILLWLFMLWASTLSQALAAGIKDSEIAMQIGILLYWLALVFCGVLMPPAQLPRFWIFMYRISPLTYLMEGLTVAGLAQTHIHCSDIETLHIPFPQSVISSSGNATTCDDYLQPYVQTFGGYVTNPLNTTECQYCPFLSANTLLESFGMNVGHTWRNAGLLACYVIFNIFATFGIFWATRTLKAIRTHS